MDDVFELKEYEEDMYDMLTDRIWYMDVLFGTEKHYKRILEELIVTARFKALSVLYPFDNYAEMEVPKKHWSWQYRCCIELYNLADKTGFINYGENGWSWGKLTDGISLQLLNELTSHVGIPKKEDEE